jgi:hypothetical protein
MLINNKALLNTLITRIASCLDVPEHVYEDATLKYEDVGAWLAAEDSPLKRYNPEVYVQGSFRLGTVVRPISDADEHDIDLVCHLSIDKEQTAQAKLKELVGERLKKRADLADILRSSRRCWILDYQPTDQMPEFHMDVLPAIPNAERPPTGILLTDTDLKLWQKSNPIAYADWFYEQMQVIFQEKRASLAENIQAEVEEVPVWQVKTPLQIAVQILKRHRDVYFQNKQEVRPVSIIITTLAARAYRNQPDVYDALTEIVRDIEMNWGKAGYVEYRNGRWWVANPVEPHENFADKWNEYPERREAFLRWVKKVRSDFASGEAKRTLQEAVEAMTHSLGKTVVANAAREMGLIADSALPVFGRQTNQGLALGDTAHSLPPRWPMQIGYKASIIGSVHLKRYGKKLWNLSDRPLPKKVWIRFSLSTNVPAPYDVRWQVVNTGGEAAQAGELRGGFYESDGSVNGVRWESTAYTGFHWVEAFIVKDAVCVARSAKKIVKIR